MSAGLAEIDSPPLMTDEPVSSTADASPAPSPPYIAPESERRRPGWREFRRAYPGILATMGIALALMLAASGYLVYKRVRYQSEIDRLRDGMTEAERRRTDLLLESTENKFRVMVELIRRQALGDEDLHLAVIADSGIMRLQVEGAFLRDMPVEMGPEKVVGRAPDTVHMAIPRGTRTVERVIGATDSWDVPQWVYEERGLSVPEVRTVRGALGPMAILLSGGTVIYSMPDAGPLADSAYVLPGSIRARADDVRAIRENIKKGMRVYFY
jgi:hypothetical protein